jgi:hypothetical protein
MDGSASESFPMTGFGKGVVELSASSIRDLVNKRHKMEFRGTAVVTVVMHCNFGFCYQRIYYV